MVEAVDRLGLLTARPDVPAAVAESLIHLEGAVRAAHEIDEPGSGLRALEEYLAAAATRTRRRSPAAGRCRRWGRQGLRATAQ
jgi:hypothetical protein